MIAKEIAEKFLKESLPDRWLHVQEAGRKAEALATKLFEKEEAELFISAVWLHDIGYAPALNKTGFHPLDGALWLKEHGYDARLVNLVANHTYARLEACMRDFPDYYKDFPLEETLLYKAMIMIDITTGPKGEEFTPEQRMDEIISRYGPDHIVSQFITNARPNILRFVKDVEEALAHI